MIQMCGFVKMDGRYVFPLVFIYIAFICQEINTRTEQQLNGFVAYIVVICEETILMIITIFLGHLVTLMLTKRYSLKALFFS